MIMEGYTEEYYVCVNNIHHYAKREDGKWLHVVFPLKDFIEFVQSGDKQEEIFSYKKGDPLINVVDDMNIIRENLPSTKEKFYNALGAAMNNLDLFRFVQWLED